MITIIPAIDLSEGKCVRLSQGDFDRKTIYQEDPVTVAKQFEAAGLKRLHMVDLDGARTGSIKNLAVLERVAAATSLDIDFGGGIQKAEDLEQLFAAGAAIVSIGSLAFSRPELILEWAGRFGKEKLLLGADVQDGFIMTRGWQIKTDQRIEDYINAYYQQGLTQFFCTDISKDGMLAGTSTELYTSLLARFEGLQLIASGGVSNMDDLYALDAIGCQGVIIGKAFYEGRITLDDLQKFTAHAAY